MPIRLAARMKAWLRAVTPQRADGSTVGTPFVILFPGRTGSTHLVSLLRSHPQVHVEGERLVHLDATAQRAFIDGLYGQVRDPSVRAVGFKTKLKDVASMPEFTDSLVRRGVRIIMLLRRNRVKLAVSVLNARRIHAERGRWNLDAGEPSLPPLEADPDLILEVAAQSARSQEELSSFVASLPLPRLDLEYESLLGEPQHALGRVQEFLEIRPLPLTSAVGKATDDRLRSSVRAFDRLVERARGTPFEQDLDEG